MAVQIWTTIPAQPGSFMDIKEDGYFFDYASKFQYKVEGDKIMYLLAGVDRFTTPQYKDTLVIKEVNDNLLVLYRQYYYVSGAYQHLEKRLDSLKK